MTYLLELQSRVLGSNVRLDRLGGRAGAVLDGSDGLLGEVRVGFLGSRHLKTIYL